MASLHLMSTPSHLRLNVALEILHLVFNFSTIDVKLNNTVNIPAPSNKGKNSDNKSTSVIYFSLYHIDYRVQLPLFYCQITRLLHGNEFEEGKARKDTVSDTTPMQLLLTPSYKQRLYTPMYKQTNKQ